MASKELESVIQNKLKRAGKKGRTSRQLVEEVSVTFNYLQSVLRKMVKQFVVERVGTSSRYTKPIYRLPQEAK